MKPSTFANVFAKESLPYIFGLMAFQIPSFLLASQIRAGCKTSQTYVCSIPDGLFDSLLESVVLLTIITFLFCLKNWISKRNSASKNMLWIQKAYNVFLLIGVAYWLLFVPGGLAAGALKYTMCGAYEMPAVQGALWPCDQTDVGLGKTMTISLPVFFFLCLLGYVNGYKKMPISIWDTWDGVLLALPFLAKLLGKHGRRLALEEQHKKMAQVYYAIGMAVFHNSLAYIRLFAMDQKGSEDLSEYLQAVDPQSVQRAQSSNEDGIASKNILATMVVAPKNSRMRVSYSDMELLYDINEALINIKYVYENPKYRESIEASVDKLKAFQRQVDTYMAMSWAMHAICMIGSNLAGRGLSAAEQTGTWDEHSQKLYQDVQKLVSGGLAEMLTLLRSAAYDAAYFDELIRKYSAEINDGKNCILLTYPEETGRTVNGVWLNGDLMRQKFAHIYGTPAAG